jgi:GMP synthase PP-ATPase subunit
MNLIRVNAKDRFNGEIGRRFDPEETQNYREEFIRVFEEESNILGKLITWYKAQSIQTLLKAAPYFCYH